jgi:hypothetical protein
MLKNNVDNLFHEVLAWVNKKGVNLIEYSFPTITELPDPETDEIKGYEFTFYSSNSMFRIWYEFPNNISCIGYDEIRYETI